MIPSLLEDEVQQAVLGCIDQPKDHASRDAGDDDRDDGQDVDRCLHGCRADRPVDEQGKAHPEQDLGWDDDETVDRRLAYGFRERRVAQRPDVVRETDELPAARDRLDDSQDERDGGDYHDRPEDGQQQPEGQPLGPGRGGARSDTEARSDRRHEG